MSFPFLSKKSSPVVGAALALALSVSAYSPAHANWERHSTGHTAVFGEGSSKFLKIMRPAMWNKNQLHVLSPADRTQHAQDEVKISGLLKSDAGFSKRFGSIIPTTTIAKHGNWVAQSERWGRKFRDLSEGDREFAQAEVSAAIAMAEKIAGRTLSHDLSNFVFERNGKIKGWFSVIDAPTGKAFPIKMVKEFTPGANATAFEVKSEDPRFAKFGVVKILKHNEPRRLPADGTDQEMTDLSLEAQYLSEVVGRDKKILKRFGDIVPKTLAIGPGVILQELAKGVGIDELHGKEKDQAKKDIADFVDITKKIVPGVAVSKHSTNFRFDKETGKMVSAYDIPSDGPRSYEKIGLTSRFFAYKNVKDSKKSFAE